MISVYCFKTHDFVSRSISLASARVQLFNMHAEESLGTRTSVYLDVLWNAGNHGVIIRYTYSRVITFASAISACVAKNSRQGVIGHMSFYTTPQMIIPIMAYVA